MSKNHGFAARLQHRDPASSLGWTDYRAGLPFHPQYDMWDRRTQRNYENGRLRAANVALAFGKIPVRQPKAGGNNIVVRSFHAVGNAIPPRRIAGQVANASCEAL